MRAMELMTFIVLLSAIATIGFLTNKYLDRKYGTRPNQAIYDEIESIKRLIFNDVQSRNDRTDDKVNAVEQSAQLVRKDFEDFKKHSANLFVAIDKKLTGLHLGEILGDKHQEVFELK